MMIVSARGITGGISSGVTNFGTSSGLSVPPGIWAIARSIQPVWLATYQATVVAPVSLRKLRRVGMVPPPWGYRGCRETRSPIMEARDVSSSMGLGLQAKHGRRPDPSDYRITSPVGVLAPPGRSYHSEYGSRGAGLARQPGSQSSLTRGLARRSIGIRGNVAAHDSR
jgi:hypothetical protein